MTKAPPLLYRQGFIIGKLRADTDKNKIFFARIDHSVAHALRRHDDLTGGYGHFFILSRVKNPRPLQTNPNVFTLVMNMVPNGLPRFHNPDGQTR